MENYNPNSSNAAKDTVIMLPFLGSFKFYSTILKDFIIF